MKKTLLIICCLVLNFVLTAFSSTDEISLYDKSGNAKAYIADDLTIYLWGGDPVAYLFQSDNEWHVYGFNGTHLGWYSNGIIYDNSGYATGAQSDALSTPTSIEPIKGIKGIKPIKSIRQIAPIKPIFSNSWSNTPLIIFLRAGE